MVIFATGLLLGSCGGRAG